MKLLSCLFIEAFLAIYGLSMVSVEAKRQSSRLYHSAEDIKAVFRDFKNDDTNVRRRLGKRGGRQGDNKGGTRSKGGSNGRKSKSDSCQWYQPYFVQVLFKPFPGTGTLFIPSTWHGLLEQGARAAIYETPLTGLATYYDGDQAMKEFPVIGQLTGSCQVVQENPPFNFNANGTPIIPESVRYISHCTVCLTYIDECVLPDFREGLLDIGGECSHPAYGSVMATGDLFSHWKYNDDANPFDLTLLGTTASFTVTGAFYDLYGAVSGGWFNFVHDGQWNLELKVPMTQKAACELQEYEYEQNLGRSS
jgi:hypothetical protein